MKRVFVLDINNVQTDYSKALEFMIKVEKNDIFECDDIKYRGCIDSDESNYQSLVELMKNCNLEKEYTKDGMDCMWCLNIHIEQSDDIINLMYLFLIKNEFNNLFAILKISNNCYIKTLDSFLPLIENKRFIFEQLNKYKRNEFSSKNKSISKDIFPIIEIDKSTYSLLAMTVTNARKSNSFVRKAIFEKCNTMLKKYRPKNNLELYNSNTKFREVLEQATVLEYILFSFFQYNFTFYREANNLEDIRLQLSYIRDISEGISRILENIILYSQNRCGYLTLGINKKKINTEYKDCLDIRIIDGYIKKENEKGNCIICENFLKKNKKIKPLKLADFFKGKYVESFGGVNIIKQHHGMYLFDQFIKKCCEGYYKVISTTEFIPSKTQCYKSYENNEEEQRVIPGTQYIINIPVLNNLNKLTRSSYTDYNVFDFFSMSVNKFFNEKNKFELINIDVPIEAIIKNKKNRQALIAEFEKNTYEQLFKNRNGRSLYIYLLNCYKIDKRENVELVFATLIKSIIRYRDYINDKRKLYLSIGKVTEYFIIEFAYLVKKFYLDVLKCDFMENVEIYIWDANNYNDLVITGSCLDTVLNIMINRAIMRGIYPKWMNYIIHIWNRNMNLESYIAVHTSKLLLYDIIIRPNKKTIFENLVKTIIDKPITEHELGGKIMNTHVQMTPKIHVTEFFNAQIVFSNNYFVKCFSFLIAMRIINSTNIENINKICLVGYESHSEMVLEEITRLLKAYYKECVLIEPYFICEKSKNGDLFFRKQFEKVNLGEKINDEEEYRDCGFIFIVPITSTLFTFENMQEALKKYLNMEIENKYFLSNLAMILSRDSSGKHDIVTTNIEKKYWLSKSDGVVVSKRNNLSVDFFVEISRPWKEAERCDVCFPLNYLDEKPLTKTDMVGLSILSQVGNKKKWNKVNNIDKSNDKRVEKLAEVLTYMHISRGENHYLYYFDTIKFFHMNQADIENKWLRNIHKNVHNYNFIISPFHNTNAAFTEAVNKIVFNNSAHVIRIDFCKTFRSNFQQLYSYLVHLCNNINLYSEKSDEKIEINFYFVDDEIVSGRTILRAKSLIESLLNVYENDRGIKINIFKKIIVLVNRLSDFSKRNYIQNILDYESFVNFNISSISNHNDFCFMCNLVNKANRYKRMSSTNCMDQFWKGKEEKFKIIPYSKIKKMPSYKRDEYKKRMIVAHEIENQLLSLPDGASAKEYFEVMISKMFYPNINGNDMNFDCDGDKKLRVIFISYVKCLSRPFFVYRDRAKEATMHLLIIFSECILLNDCDEILGKIKSSNIAGWIENVEKQLCSIFFFLDRWKQDDISYQNKKTISIYQLLCDIIEELADMSANYIIRKDTILNLLEFGKRYNEINPNGKKQFELVYASAIKKITSEDAQELKSLWVEHLFLFSRELNSSDENLDLNFQQKCGIESTFGTKILIENTKILYDGIKYLYERLKQPLDNEKNSNIELIEKLLHLSGENCEIKFEEELSCIRNKIRNICANELNMLNDNYNLPTPIYYLSKVLNYYSNKNIDKYIAIIADTVFLFGVMFSKEMEYIPFNHFYKLLYRIIRELTNAEVQFLMFPVEQNSREKMIYSEESCVIYDERKEDNVGRRIELSDCPMIDVSYLNEVGEFDTYYLDLENNKVVIKYIIDSKHRDETDNIYLILKYDDNKNISEIVFCARCILLFRSRTLIRMIRDFTNNIFQNLWETKRYNMLLKHFKNVSHTETENSTNTVLDHIKGLEYCGKDIYEHNKKSRALLIKMLADNNISLIYHEILAKYLLAEGAEETDFLQDNILKDLDIFKIIVSEEAISRNVNVDKEVCKGRIYYLAGKPYCSHFIILSLVQNAIKHGIGDVSIYTENCLKWNSIVNYLCITNQLDPLKNCNVKERIEEHISVPVSLRKIDKGNNQGITLYSVNEYCKKILESIIYDSDISKIDKQKLVKDIESNRVLDYSISGEQIIFKIPLMKKKDGENI